MEEDKKINNVKFTEYKFSHVKKNNKLRKNHVYLKSALPLIFDLIKWIVIDIYRFFKDKDRKVHIYGIYGYFGLPGKGKTVALAELGLRYRQKYGDKIYIVDNFGYEYSDWHFDSANWKELLIEQDKPTLYLFDEVQNIFNSRDFKNFPTELLVQLTQNRKGNGKMICYSAQRWGRVDKVFRELSHKCYECKTLFKRLTITKAFDWEDYEMYVNSTDVRTRMKIHSRRYSFIQTDQIRNSYNSFKMLKSARDKMYMDRTEIAQLTR